MEKAKLNNFKKIIIKSMNISTEEEMNMFNQIPDSIISDIFENNFNGNYQLARNIILNNFEQDSYKRIENEKNKIHDMEKASIHLANELKNGKKVLFVTDTDNDGSLSQSNVLEFKRALNDEEKNKIDILFCQQINGNNARGFTVDLIDEWVNINTNFKKEAFTIISADNGINSVEEQEKINKKYPNATLIVTDHHLPDEEFVVVKNEKTLIVNPKYKPSKFFKEKNISGANVLGKLLEKTLDNLEKDNVELKNKEVVVSSMKEISRIANLLDYVDTDITDKPLKNNLVEKYSSLGGLMNVNNSLNKIIVSDLSKESIESLFKEFKNEDFDLELVKNTIQKIKEQNIVAKKTLNLQKQFDALSDREKNAIPKDRINEDLIVSFEKNNNETKENKDINPNYVEQLRPFIYNYAASSSLIDYEKGIFMKMEDIYLNLKKLERILQTEFGKVNVLDVNKLENSTIMFPKNSNHLTLLNRKLLGKIYNEENNGFLMILDSVSKEKASGSFRSVYRIQDILKDKEKIEKVLNIKLSFMGHDKAAGFFIEKTDGSDLSHSVINEVNRFINKRLETLKVEDKKSYSHLIQTDFHYPAIALFNKFNQAVKGNLTNMQSLSPVIQFNKSTYLTDSKTQNEKSLQQLIKDKRYGYVPVEISFDGKTIILPTEMLRQISNSNFKDGIQVSFMADGVFIGNKVIKDINKQNLIKIKSPKNNRDEMIEFFNKTYVENNYFVELPKEKIKESPFFKYNKFGASEYNRFESLIIDVIDRSSTDMIVVADTEANGLGNAPKVCNFGVVEMKINEDSGYKLKKESFESAHFESLKGNKYLLSRGQINKLEKINNEEFKGLTLAEKNLVMKNHKTEEMFKTTENQTNNYIKLNNYKTLGDKTVIVNRELRFEIGSMFIKDLDTKMSERIISLTSIDNTLLNKVGITSEEADNILTERYKDKKCVFQAHNLPYDLGVIKGNFKNYYNVVTDFEKGNLLNDSAIYSREAKLAYDPINIGTFEKDFVPALAQIHFYESEYSDLSLSSFLSTDEDGTLSDRTDRYILNKKNGKITLTDKKENTEVSVIIDHSNVEKVLTTENENMLDEKSEISILKELIVKSEMPGNSIKYSVQALSDYDIIRSLILSTKSFEIETVDIPTELKEHKETIESFMMNYHFDSSTNENVHNFFKALNKEERKTMFVTKNWREEELERMEKLFDEEQSNLPARNRKRKRPSFADAIGIDPKMESFTNFIDDFLEKNKDIQAKFHEVWAYKKVLQCINPTKETLKDKDIMDHVVEVTSLPRNKVELIIKDAIDFKNIYKIDSVIQKEPHNNVFFDKCDVVLEAVLTFKRPSDRSYNSYTNSVDNVVDMYLGNIVKTSGQHVISQQRKMAADSFSRKQALAYKRKVKTDYIIENQEISENVKFKFSADTLPMDTFAYGELKKELTEKEIVELSKKLEFVVRNEQMRFSIDEKVFTGEHDEIVLTGMKRMLKCNEKTVKELKDDIAEHFESIYYSRKENEFKKCLKMVISAYTDNTPLVAPRTLEPMMKREKNTLIELSKKISDIAVNLGINAIEPLELNDVNLVKGLLTPIEKVKVGNPIIEFFDKIPEISEELVVERKNDFDKAIKNAESESERKVLIRNKIIPDVKVKRRNDANHMFKFQELMGNYMNKISTIDGSKELFSMDLEKDLEQNKANIEAIRIKENAKKAAKKTAKKL